MEKIILPKIKIPKQDLKSFLLESLEIDPFWYDVYGIEPQEVKEKDKQNK
jgi:hypothetical protein